VHLQIDPDDLHGFNESSRDEEHQDKMRKKKDCQTLVLRMIMLHRIIPEGKIKMRMRNRPPAEVMRMVEGRSRHMVAQEENHQHPFTCFYQRLFHSIDRITPCKDSNFFHPSKQKQANKSYPLPGNENVVHLCADSHKSPNR
jgi:hypothetical protein